MDIKIGKIIGDITVEGMVVKSTRGKTEENITIFEDNVQLKLRNTGKSTFEIIDCNIEYKNSKNEFIGFDSDGTFHELGPSESCLYLFH